LMRKSWLEIVTKISVCLSFLFVSLRLKKLHLSYWLLAR
jgi:hypothetical protein